MGKWEITMNPVQEWGEEFEDGAVYGVTLRREPVPSSAAGADGDGTQPCSAYVQYRTCKVRRLKAATLDILVGELLDPRCQDPDYAGIFLSTYRTFTSPPELIKLLFKKDKAASDLDNSECQTSSPLSVLIQTWLEEYSEDLRDPPFHSPLRNLVEHLRSRAKFCSLARCAETLLQRFQAEETKPNGPCAWADVEREEEENSVEEAAEWERPAEQGDITDFSVTSIAEQLTRLDSSLFAKVVPYQCLGCVWSQRDKKENMSPTIRATITQFNAITNGVITSLLCWPVAGSSSPTQPRRPTSSPAQRARVIEKWIRVAQECRQLKNFSSLRAILSALQSNAVYRLRRTWAAVSRESMATFDNLWETFPDENCVLTSREILLEDGGQQPAMDNTSPGPSKRCPVARQLSASCVVVPYLGTYLTVLTMLDTALPDIVDNLINFEKRRREFDILSQIRLLQMSCSQYNLPHHPKIHAWLQEHTQLTDQESYELSRGLEPPVDMCSPAAWNHRTISKKLSFLLTGDGSKKASGDQMSVCSSGSSGSEMEDLSSSNSACSIRLQTLSTSCQNVAEASSSSSSSSSSLECPATSSSSSSSQPDLSNPAPVPDADPGPKPASAPHHQRSISMTSLPVYNRQVADSCIVRVSVDLGTDNGNMYKSILLTSQDKTAQVIQRALEKHHLEERNHEDFTLAQVISQERELIIPDKANVFYAMSTSANYDFVLRPTPKGQKRPLAATSSLGRYSR